MSVVLVTGAAGRFGRRVVPLIAADDDVERVIALDTAAIQPAERVQVVRADLLDVDLDALLRGVSCVVHLASSGLGDTDVEGARRVNVDGTARLLDAMGRVGVAQLVGLSSAMVYGAWPDNPVPLTEERPVRPNPEFAYAVQLAEMERLVAQWASDGDGRVAAVLRPTSALSESDASYGARSLAAAAGFQAGVAVPPSQFVSLDDVASAIALARRAGLGGAFNVAPDGWVRGETVRELTGAPPRVQLPTKVAARVASWSWEFQLGPIPPGLLPYTMHPWVVANDKLEAAGWRPTSTNEEAYVAGTDGSWWSMLSPKRRQELALGASGLLLLVSGAATAFGLRGALRRRKG